MLVTLLVLWVVVVPLLTVIGTFVLSGWLRRSGRGAADVTPIDFLSTARRRDRRRRRLVHH